MRYVPIALLLAALAGFLATAPPRAASQPSASEPERLEPAEARAQLEGRYELAGAQPEASRRVEAAIERAIAGMTFLERPFARRRLASTNEVFTRVAFRFHGDGRIETHLDGEPIVSPADGTKRPLTLPGGERVEVSQRQSGTHVVQRFFSDDGKRINDFALDPSSGELTLRVSARSPRLPRPVRYTLRFERTSPSVAMR